MKLTNYGTTFKVYLSSGWSSDDVDTRTSFSANRILLSFRLVQELHISNALNAAMLSSPQSLNWGMNEISVMKLADSSVPWPGPLQNHYFHRAEFLWEGERKITVVFRELHVAYPGLRDSTHTDT